MKQFQQGDVFFHTTRIPNTTAMKSVISPVIQEGEHTGHAHRIVMFRHGVGSSAAETNWEMLLDEETRQRYLRIGDPGIDISHEEHKTIHLPPGEYEIGIVREYDHFAEEARFVAD